MISQFFVEIVLFSVEPRSEAKKKYGGSEGKNNESDK